MDIIANDKPGWSELPDRMLSFRGYFGNEQKHNMFPSGSITNILGRLDGGKPAKIKTSSPSVSEMCRNLKLWLKYYIHHPIKIKVIIPEFQNTDRKYGVREKSSGDGNMNLFISYHMIGKTTTRGWQNQFIGITGIKLPAGLSSVKKLCRVSYELIIQPGMCTPDYFLSMNHPAYCNGKSNTS